MEDLFYSEQHREFYRHHVDGGADPYYRALVYLLGMTEETRANFSRCFDGEARMIRPPWGRADRRAVQRGSCAWPSISGTGGATSRRRTRRRAGCQRLSRRTICSAVNLPPTSMRQSSCGIQNIRTTPGSELSKPAGPSDRWEARRNTACPGGEPYTEGRTT